MAKDTGGTWKAVVVPIVAYGLCVVASVVFLFVTAVISAEWGAKRTGDAMMVMLGADTLLFLGSALALFFVLGRWVGGVLWRLLICGLYVALSVGAMVVITFLSAVALNR